MYRVRTILTGVTGTPWYSNMFFSDQNPGGAAGAVSAVAAFWTALNPQLSQLVSWTVEGDVTIISEGTGQIEGIFPEDSETGQGSNAGEALPWATQGLIQWRTGAYMGGREIRGRTFIPGLTETSSDDGTPTGVALSVLGTAAGNLVSAAGADLVVFSRKNFIASPVISSAVADYWAVLRSRRD